MFTGPFDESIIKRAREKSLVQVNIHDLRNWSIGKHKIVDDKPYGGGPGMVLMVEPIYKALKTLKGKSKKKPHTILLSPQGEKFNQEKAKKLVKKEHLILIAGHYEGFDERVRKHLINEEISIGDYVLTGGELPAMVVTDTIVRLIPGVLGDENSRKDETHSKKGKVKYPVYTRPEQFNGWKVPDVLLSGHHAEIKKWKNEMQEKGS